MVEHAKDKSASADKPKRQRLTADQKIARLEAQIQRLKTQEHKRSRKLDAREKIIIGGAVLKAMRNHADWKERVCQLLNDDVTRPIDREVIAEWLSDTSMSA